MNILVMVKLGLIQQLTSLDQDGNIFHMMERFGKTTVLTIVGKDMDCAQGII
jgi:hypothetical protein